MLLSEVKDVINGFLDIYEDVEVTGISVIDSKIAINFKNIQTDKYGSYRCDYKMVD